MSRKKKYLTVNEVSKLLGFHPRTIHRHLRNGVYKSIVVSVGTDGRKRHRILAESLEPQVDNIQETSNSN